MDWDKFGFNLPEDQELPCDHESFSDDDKFFLVAVGIGKAMQLRCEGAEKIAYEVVKQALLFLREEVNSDHLQKAKDISKTNALKCGCKVCQQLLKWIDRAAARKEAEAKEKVDVIDPFSDKFE